LLLYEVLQRLKSIMKYAAPVLVLGLGAGAYVLLHAAKPEPDKRDEAARPVTVFVEQVKPAQVQLDVVTQGEVRSRITIELVAQVGGRITAVSPEFTEGGTVLPGATLLSIEDTDYRLALSRAQAQVAAAKVAVELAHADADVARKQLRNSPNPSALALKKPQVAEALAQMKAAQADLQQAQVNLDRTSIALPFQGRIAKTYADLGQYVASGTPLGQAFATDRVEIRLPINDAQLASLGLPIGYVAGEDGGPVVELSARVAGQQQLWTGRLVRLDASIDSDTRLLYAMAVVDDPYGENASAQGMPLAIGLYVSARIFGREISNAVQISSSALRAGDTVYVVNSAGLLEIRNVSVSHSSPEFAIIENGLVSGDRVIISSIRNPIPGMALRASEPNTPDLASTEKSKNGSG
jgi:RND family efflux transporter MFP subunit